MYWILTFIVIGLCAGMLSKRMMHGIVPDKTLWPVALGIAGSVIGGMSTILLFDYGRAHSYHHGFTYADDGTGSTLPAYWMSPLVAIAGALLVLTVYRLMRSRLPLS